MDWLKGKRVKLRAVEPEDLKKLYKWENDTSLWKVSDTVEPYSEFILKRYIDQAPKDIYENRQLKLIIEKTDEGTPKAIGMVDLFEFDPFHQRAAVGIDIDEACKRKGFGSEAITVLKNYAFNYLQLHMLHCHIGVDNPDSIAFFKKNEFVVCGELKNWLKGVDGFVNSLILQCMNPKISEI